MVILNIRQTLNGMNIMSQDKTWELLLSKISDTISNTSEEYLLDFTGVSVSGATDFPNFKKLLRQTNIHMKFVNQDDLMHNIKMLCILDSIPYENRFENENTPKVVAKTPAQIKLEKNGENILSKFIVDADNKKAKFIVVNTLRQFYNNDTCTYVDYAIDKLAKQGITDVLIDLKGVATNTVVLTEFCNICKRFSDIGVNVVFDVDDGDTARDFKLCMYKSQKDSFTPLKRARIINNFYKQYGDTAGLLIKYEKSRTTDEFGRFGKGQVASCKVALFMGLKRMGDSFFATFETFSVKGFLTIAQYYSYCDCKVPEKIPSEIICVDVADLGFIDDFLGPHYHFVLPIQRNSSETKKIPIGFNERGNNITKSCTLPERIMYVFNDFNIKCNMELLKQAIEESEQNR